MSNNKHEYQKSLLPLEDLSDNLLQPWLQILSSIQEFIPQELTEEPEALRLKMLLEELTSQNARNLLESHQNEIDHLLDILSQKSQQILKNLLPDVK